MADHMVTVERECVEIQQDIKRLGEVKDGKYTVKFGVLYDDDKVQQYYEALVGTLKAAKKRGIISFQSQLLLKGKLFHMIFYSGFFSKIIIFFFRCTW